MFNQEISTSVPSELVSYQLHATSCLLRFSLNDLNIIKNRKNSANKAMHRKLGKLPVAASQTHTKTYLHTQTHTHLHIQTRTLTYTHIHLPTQPHTPHMWSPTNGLLYRVDRKHHSQNSSAMWHQQCTDTVDG